MVMAEAVTVELVVVSRAAAVVATRAAAVSAAVLSEAMLVEEGNMAEVMKATVVLVVGVAMEVSEDGEWAMVEAVAEARGSWGQPTPTGDNASRAKVEAAMVGLPSQRSPPRIGPRKISYLP